MPFLKGSIRRATAVLLAGGLLMASSAVAPATAQETIISTADLGLGDSTVFLGRSAEVPFTIAVPAGTTPEVLTGTFQLPTDFDGGVIELYSGDRLLDSQTLEVEGFLAEVEIPLAQVPVEEGLAGFTLRAVMNVTGDQWCREIPELTLINGEVRYAGESTRPQVVADFLPPILRTLNIYVPADPSEAVQQATLELATSMASVYRATGVEVQVIGLPEGSAQPSAPAGSGERNIVLSDTGTAGIELINPGSDDVFLRINGEDQRIFDQARLLTDSLLPLAADDQVTGSGFGAIPDVSTDMATLTALGNFNLTSESVARTAVFVGIERSQLRPFVESFDVHLTGNYTPLPANNSGQITTRIGDTVLDYFTVDNSGVIDRTISVPGELIDRFTQLVVEYHTTGEITCGTTQPVGLTIDGDSLVTTQHTDVPILTGFQSLPQAFQPTVDVAMTNGDVADLSRAASILTGVQSLSNVRVRPELVAWDDAVASTRATLFIDAEGERVEDLPRYIAEAGINMTVVTRDGSGGVSGEPTPEDLEYARQLTLNRDIAAGGIQAVWDAEVNRMILVASSNQSARQLDGVISWLAEDDSRWAQLRGDVIAQVLDRTPVDLEVAGRPDQPSNRATVWMAVAVAVVVIAVAVAASLLVSRRSRKPAAHE